MWKTDLSFIRICGTKLIHLFEDGKTIEIYVPSARQRLFDEDIAFMYNFLYLDLEDMKDKLPIKAESMWDLLSQLITQPRWTNLRETKKFRKCFENSFKKLVPSYSFENGQLSINNIPVNHEIWKWLTYIWKFADNSKDLLPPDQENEATLKQQALQKKIQKMKQKDAVKNYDVNDDSFMKMLILIEYSFPGIDYNSLWEKTMNELQWLKVKAEKAASYEIERVVYSTGNSKKKKLDFFLKD